jgi:hypothetical protein
MDFDQVCELSSVAAKFEIPALVQRCRSYLWASLYPSNVWRAYQCATAANDTKLQAMALQVRYTRKNYKNVTYVFGQLLIRLRFSE